MHGHLKIETHIFLTGATGYIGGSILTLFLSHPLSDTFQLTILVRDPDKAAQFRTMGVKAVVGSHSDQALVRKLAEGADVVFACADADDKGAAQAILDGLKNRYKKTGKVSSLIHTSGTGTLVDNAQGMYATDTIYSDLDIAQIESLPDTAPHRNVDLMLVQADEEGYVHTYILLPSTIYGTATGPLVDAGLQNPYSQQIPNLVDVAVQRGCAGMVGEGRNVWGDVHISDVADLYILIFEHILSPLHPTHPFPPIPPSHKPYLTHGRSGYYFLSSSEHTLLSLAQSIGSSLVEFGITDDPTPTTFTEEEMGRYWPNGTAHGTNSRCKAERARLVGWEPKVLDVDGSVREEVERRAGAGEEEIIDASAGET